MEKCSALALGGGEVRLPARPHSPARKTSTMQKWNSNCWICREKAGRSPRIAAITHPLQAMRRDPPYIYCAAEAGWQARQLTDEQWTGIIADLLQAFPKHTIVVHGAAGAVKEFALEARVVAYGQGSVQELFDKVSAAELVIAPDSFALHLASLYDVPAIGYFGPAHPHRFRPTGPGSSSLFHQPECSPCLQLRGDSPCRKGLIQCSSLAAMRPAEFVAAAQAALVGWSLTMDRHGHYFAHA